MNYTITCPHCNSAATVPEPGLYSCPTCAQQIEVAQPLQQQTQPPPAVVPPHPFNDTLFNEDGVVITRSQVLVTGAIFSVPQIAGVIKRETRPPRSIPGFFFIFGLFILLSAFLAPTAPMFYGAAICIIPSAIVLWIWPSKFSLDLNTSGGAYKIKFSKRAIAERAAFALSTAMAAR